MTAFDLAIVALAGAALGLLLYARGRAPADPDVLHRPATRLLGHRARHALVFLLSPVERAAVRRRIPPIAFNYAGLLLALASGVFYGVETFAVAGLLLLLSGAADVLDGRVARALDAVSLRGAFLDSALDRFAELAVYLGLTVAFRQRPAAVVAVTLALGASLLVSYARARGQSLGVDVPGGAFARAERFVILGGASLLEPVGSALGASSGAIVFAAVVVIAAGSLATAIGRVISVAQALAARDAASHGSGGGRPPSVPGFEFETESGRPTSDDRVRPSPTAGRSGGRPRRGRSTRRRARRPAARGR